MKNRMEAIFRKDTAEKYKAIREIMKKSEEFPCGCYTCREKRMYRNYAWVVYVTFGVVAAISMLLIVVVSKI